MEVRAIRDLAQLSDKDLFAEASIGLGLIAAHVVRLCQGAEAAAAAGYVHSGRVLTKIAEEEAGKFLILIDAIRCPRQPADRLARHLRRFNQHLEKALYARACAYRPGTLAQLQTYLDPDRKEFYLDGPNDVDWIFRNELIDGRETTLYVDYVRHDDAHRWADPLRFEELYFGVHEPAAVRLVKALSSSGLDKAGALATVAEVWRRVEMTPDRTFAELRDLMVETLGLLKDRGQLVEQPIETYRIIADDWVFPMYGLDLSLVEVDLKTLRERQREWSPGW